MSITQRRSLDSNAIKLIAILAMTVDHIAWAVFPGYPRAALPLLMHLIGRITCPIMCYFIAEGFHYTHDVRKYTARLFLFALFSHFCYLYASNDFVDWHSFIPFYYGSLLNQTSVMWSLARYFGVSVDWLLGLSNDRYEAVPSEVREFATLYALASPDDRTIVETVLKKYREEN